jgi:acetyl-CoA C-acetyltransferase
MTDIVIAAARRTPVGSFMGSFAGTPAHELGRLKMCRTSSLAKS